MIEALFNLKTIPFSKSIQVDNLYRHDQFEELLRRMNRLITNRGIGLFTGEVGCGKTTAIRSVLDTLSPQTYKIVYVYRDAETLGAFYKQIAAQLGVMPLFGRSELSRAVIATIEDLFMQQKITTVLVMDEAHLLKPELMDEIRLIHNSQYDSSDYLATLLIGQPALKKMISFNKFLPLRQRIATAFHLKPLSKKEAYDYFQHQLDITQANTKIFMDNAIETIITVAKGIPRVINTVALKAMYVAAEKKMTTVDQECVMVVLDELSIK